MGRGGDGGSLEEKENVGEDGGEGEEVIIDEEDKEVWESVGGEEVEELDDCDRILASDLVELEGTLVLVSYRP